MLLLPISIVISPSPTKIWPPSRHHLSSKPISLLLPACQLLVLINPKSGKATNPPQPQAPKSGKASTPQPKEPKDPKSEKQPKEPKDPKPKEPKDPKTDKKN
jgi:hypothetical protein